MAPSNYNNNYYTAPAQQQQSSNDNYNSYTNSRTAATHNTQYQPTSVTPPAQQYQPPATTTAAQNTVYPQYARTNERYHATQSTPNYSSRTNYDTNALGALSHTGITTTDTGRSSTSSHGISSHHATSHVAAQTQAYAPPQQTAYSASAYAGYGEQQARPNSVNSVDSSQSGLSMPRAVQNTQSQPISYQQQSTTSISQRTRSPLQNQWTAHNQASRASRPTEVVSRHTPQQTQTQSWQTQTSRDTEPLTQSLTRPSSDHLPAPATVDPTQVYDPYQEYQRQAKRREAEAEQRKATEAAEAAEKGKAEEAAQAQAREAEKNMPKPNPPQAAPLAVSSAEPEVPAKKKRSRKSEGTGTESKSSKSKSKSKKSAPATDVDEPAQAAAMTLMQTANSGTETDLEAQMLEMFKKMRQFNAMNPEMLSRLWQQERDEHLSKEAAQQASPVQTNAQSASKARSQKETPGAEPVQSPMKSNGVKANSTVPRKAAGSAQPGLNAAGSTAAVNTKQTASAVPTATAQAPTAAGSSTASAQITRHSGTIWPADKKQTLAATASHLLQNMPANKGKVISPSDISAILDGNPSYIELCQKIESRGFVVDRGSFAKALLAAVPDVNKSAQKPLSASGNGSAVTNGGNLTAGSLVGTASNALANTNTPLSNAADRLLSGGNVVESPALAPSKSKAVVDGPKEKTGRQRKSKKASMAEAPDIAEDDQPPIPSYDDGLEGLEAVKQFVDGSWQEASPATIQTPTKSAKAPRTSKAQSRPSVAPQPPAPVTKEDLARKRTFADLVDLTQLNSDDEDVVESPPAKRHEAEFVANSSINQLPTPPETLVGANATPLNSAPMTASLNLAPMVSNCPNSTRPVPLAPAPAPTQYAQIEAPPSTFRPPPIDHPSRSIVMVQPLDKYKAIRRSTYNSKTIARDVLLACGRHPDMRHLNAHLEIFKNVFTSIDNGSDLGTFRWDIADPGGPLPGSGNQLPPGLAELDLSDDADDEDDDKYNDNDSVLGGATVRQVIGPNGASEVEGGSFGRFSVQKLHAKKSRHSEPGMRVHAEQPGRSTRPRHSEGGNIRPNAASENVPVSGGGSAPSGYSALRALQAAQAGETPVKKKGRPVGWRKWMMSDPAAYAGGAQSPKCKAPRTIKPAQPDPEPVYQVYKCDWRECGAELHNLATLRKHIYKLHGKKDERDMYPCHWNECGKVRSVTENGRTSSRFVNEEFGAGEQWKQHMEKKHIQPIAWELGDGPAGGLSDQQDSELSEAYLSDSHGRRVTPAVVVPSLSAVVATSTPRGLTNAEREARELQRAAEKRKRDMGPGIDKGGARLANDKRRMGFVDDDDMAEVVDGDD